jgi:hypothetical protein
MKPLSFAFVCSLAGLVAVFGCGRANPSNPSNTAKAITGSPQVFKAQSEVEARYPAAHPEIQEYVLWTAQNFGPDGLWVPEDAFAGLSPEAREKRVNYLSVLFNESEYGRHLCARLAEAGALKDKRLVPGLMKIAGYHVEGQDYDCRPKWMAVAALARQESAESVPLLISLVDHGNQNTRNWARAALSRQTGQDFKQDKQAWANWWQAQGHPPVDEQFLKPSKSPN